MGVTGVADLIGQLRDVLPEETMDPALQKGAEVIRRRAVQACQSREVAQTIHVEHGDKGWDVVADHPRARIEEFGSGPREGLQGPHNFPARSYLRRARDEGAEEAYGVVAEELKKAMG